MPLIRFALMTAVSFATCLTLSLGQGGPIDPTRWPCEGTVSISNIVTTEKTKAGPPPTAKATGLYTVNYRCSPEDTPWHSTICSWCLHTQWAQEELVGNPPEWLNIPWDWVLVTTLVDECDTGPTQLYNGTSIWSYPLYGSPTPAQLNTATTRLVLLVNISTTPIGGCQAEPFGWVIYESLFFFDP
jgi:hypothetical protein